MSVDLGGDYEVIGVLGSGSFGTVCKVRRVRDGLLLACKSVVYSGMDLNHKEQLVAEVNIMRELTHHHIVEYLDRRIDKKNGTLHILMELCVGGDLGKIIRDRKRQRRPLSEERIWHILHQAALALSDCHAKTFLHRDIKPQNILFDARGSLKLADFGLAKELKTHQALAHTKLGTPLYMAPEIIQHKPYGAPADIWSLGCVVHEAAALAPPFDEADADKLKSAILAGSIKHHIPDDYTLYLKDIIASLYRPQPKSRPTAVQLLMACTEHFSIIPPRIISQGQPPPLLLSGKKPTRIESKSALCQREQKLKEREKLLDARECKLNDRERKLILREAQVANLAPVSSRTLLAEKTVQQNIRRRTEKENEKIHDDQESTKRRRRI